MTILIAGLVSAICAVAWNPGLATTGEPAPLILSAIAVPPAAFETTGSRGPHADCSVRPLGGLVLSSSDDRFGGYSGVAVDPETGALLLISDYGLWVRAGIRRDADGRLAGLDDVVTGRLTDRSGQPLAGKNSGDAESVRFDGPGRVLVSFEFEHRIDAYDVARAGGLPQVTGPAHPVEAPAGIALLDSNAGIEALAVIQAGDSPAGGDLLAIAEAGPHASPGTPAWLRSGGRWIRTRYSPKALYRPTDAAALGDGSVIVLERRFDPLSERVSARLAALDAAGIREALAGRSGLPRPRRLCAFPPQPLLDNVEGIAAFAPDGSGRATRLLMISDDNRSPKQKTILYEFDIDSMTAIPSRTRMPIHAFDPPGAVIASR